MGVAWLVSTFLLTYVMNCRWLFTLLWFLILLVVWPISMLCGMLYAMVLPFKACCAGCTVALTNVLMKGVTLAHDIAVKMVAGSSFC